MGSCQRKLFIHVGHGKTATTWLQTSFRLSAQALARHGIFYPMSPEEQCLGVTRITSGNSYQYTATPKALREKLTEFTAETHRHSILFSSEFNFEELVSWARQGVQVSDVLNDIASEAGFSGVEILLFIRNPIGMASSAFQQMCKRGGLVTSIDDYFRRFDMPDYVADFLKGFETRVNVRLTVMNYSVVRDRMLEVAAIWLGVPQVVLERPSAMHVNRSLTHGELALQRAVNGVLGVSGDVLSDPLCEQLPHIKSDANFPATEIQEALWIRCKDAIDYVNARVPQAQVYTFDSQPPTPEMQQATFTREQIEVIGRSLATANLTLQNAVADLQAKIHILSTQLSETSRLSEILTLLREREETSAETAARLEQMSSSLETAASKRDALLAQLETANREIFRIKRRPWKYLGASLKMRIQQGARGVVKGDGS